LIIPWEVDVPPDHRPIMNWLIIVGIIGMFALQFMPTAEEREVFEQWQSRQNKKTTNQISEDKAEAEEALPRVGILTLVLEKFEMRGLLGHMWLHGGILHILGNLIFLRVFGNAVCSKVGNLFYLPIYLGLGVWSGIWHLVFQGGSMIGASGAIMGVVGMYLVFFPKNDITCYWFSFYSIIPRAFTIASYWMILMWVGFDIFGAYAGGGRVAYFAHLGGFATGFGVAALMLKMKWVEINPRYEESLFDVFSRKDTNKNDETRSTDPNYAWLREQAQVAERGDSLGNAATDIDGGGRGRSYDMLDEPAITEPLTPVVKLEKPVDEMIRFKCSCGKQIKVASKYAGKSGKCPRCKNKIRVPAE